MKYRELFYCVILAVLFSSCYSFRGTSISPDLKSYYVNQTITANNSNAALAPGDLPERFMEALRAKVRNQSSLIYNNSSPDIEFESTITAYNLSDDTRTTGNTVTALRKLTAAIQVNYINNSDEEENWTQTFSHTVNFDPSTDFQSSQDTFIDEILEQITEQVFNKSFINW